MTGFGTDQYLARITGPGVLSWYLTDDEGSIRDLVNTSGSVIDHVAYDAYGNVTSESSPSSGDRFKFDGMAWDAALGDYYDNARYYDSVIGMFLSQDPTGFDSGTSNLRSFTENDPSNFGDSSGLVKIEVRYRNPIGGKITDSPYHSFIVVTDNDGTQTYFSGRPENEGQKNNFGRLLTNYGPYDKTSYDWTGDQKLVKPDILVDNNEPAKPYIDRLTATMKFYDSQNIPYVPTGPNSNSVTSNALQDLFPDPKTAPPKKTTRYRVLAVPGWYADLPNAPR